jgi:hypothetical protein
MKVFASLGLLMIGQSGAASVSAPVLAKTLPASWDESWFGSPAVFDLDGDGAMEIIAGRHSVLYAWNAQGTLLWRAPVGKNGSLADVHGSARQYAGAVVGDFDGDGKGEIAVAYGLQVAVYDRAGQLRPGWPATFPATGGDVRSVAAADLDNDGHMEILAVKTGTGPATVAWRLDGTVVPGWPQVKGCDKCNEYGGYNQNIGAADLDGDGKPEVVSTYDESYIGIMSAAGAPHPADASFAGPFASSIPMFHDLALARQGWGADGNDRDEFTSSGPVFADIDGDGMSEVILYSDHEKAGEYLNRGNCLWALHADMTRAKGFEKPLCSEGPLYTGYEDNIVEVAPMPALADLAGDARPEIVAPSYDGRMRCYSPDGGLLWSYAFDTAGIPFIGASEAAIGDLNKDGSSEVVFTTYSPAAAVSHLIILDAAGRELHKIAIAGRGAMGPPTLADVDGDHRLDIVVSLKDVVGGGSGGVQIWTIASAGDGPAPWPTGRGNLLRNGRWGGSGPASIFARPAREIFRKEKGASRAGPYFDLLGIDFGSPVRRRASILLGPGH